MLCKRSALPRAPALLWQEVVSLTVLLRPVRAVAEQVRADFISTPSFCGMVSMVRRRSPAGTAGCSFPSSACLTLRTATEVFQHHPRLPSAVRRGASTFSRAAAKLLERECRERQQLILRATAPLCPSE
jgi:hypothetical protein